MWFVLTLEELVNKYVTGLAARVRSKKQSSGVAFSQTDEFQKALEYVKSKASKGGSPVPADEDGLEALVEAKYKL